MPVARRRSRGVVLVVVLFFALLLASTVATFSRKALIDHMIVANRDARARAEALARGGIRLATMALMEDRLRQDPELPTLDHSEELWARLGRIELAVDEDATLRIVIEDASSRLNLNAVLEPDVDGALQPNAEPLLLQLLEKAVDEIPLPPGEKLYDPGELVANLIDYVDADNVRQRGGPEDEDYQDREPPSRPPNGPLLSVEELRNVQGFDAWLVDALRPYVTVYPFVGGGGINPNTAPPHVLGLLFFDDGVSLRMAGEDTVRELLLLRREGGLVCEEGQSGEACTPIRDVVTNSIYPTPTYSSDVFRVVAQARVGDIQRSVEAVLDRSQGASPLLLSWQVR